VLEAHELRKMILYFFPKHTQRELCFLLALMKNYDQDSNGFLTVDELRKMLNIPKHKEKANALAQTPDPKKKRVVCSLARLSLLAVPRGKQVITTILFDASAYFLFQGL
jgi:hypothetical protein